MNQTKNPDYAEYLAADYIDNRLFEDMTVREYVEGEILYGMDAITGSYVDEDYATKEEAIVDFTTYVEKVYEAYQRENNL